MVSLLIWVFTVLLGHTEGAIRIGAMASWLVATYYVYKLTHRTCSANAALRALLPLVVFPIYFCIGLVMTPGAPLIACWAGCVYYLYRSLVEGCRRSWLAPATSLEL